MAARPSPGAVGWSALGLCVCAGALFGVIVLVAVESRGTDDLFLPGLLPWSAAVALLAGLVAVVLTPRGLATYLSVAALLMGLFGVGSVGLGIGLNASTACARHAPSVDEDLIALQHEVGFATSTIECQYSDPVEPVAAPVRYRIPAAAALRGVRPFPAD